MATIITTVETTIRIRFNILTLPEVISSNKRVKFKNGTNDNNGEDDISTINAIIPGKKEIKVMGVSALWASLNVFDLLAIAIHKPLTKNE